MFRKTILVLATVSAAVALVVFAAVASSFVSAGSRWRVDVPASAAARKTAAGEPIVGVFTGAHVNGAPVYRLPPVIVAVDRKAALARIEREERESGVDSASRQAAAGASPPHSVHAAVATPTLQK